MIIDDEKLTSLTWEYHGSVRRFEREKTDEAELAMNQAHATYTAYRDPIIAAELAKAAEILKNQPKPVVVETHLPYWKTEKGKAAAARYWAKKKASQS